MTRAPVPGAGGPAVPSLPPRLALPALIGTGAGLVLFAAALAVTGSAVVAAAAGLGALVAAVAVAEPLVALVLLAGLEVSQAGAVLAGLGVPSPLVVTQALAVAALGLALVRGRLRVPPSPVLAGAALLLASRAASVLGAQDQAQALATTVSEARDLLTLLVAYALLAHTRGAVPLVRVCVAVLAGLSLLGGVQEYVLANSTEFLGLSQVNPPDVGSSSFRHTGPIGDPNFWGRVLVCFLPFGLALALAPGPARSRAAWWAASGSLLLGVFLTQSRGAYLATGAAVVVLLVLAGWRYARWLALTPVLVALLLALPATGPRLATLADLGQSAQGGGDLSLVLRLASQEAGLRMLADRPWLGVGAGNYEALTPRYESGLAFATVGELGRPLAPHNAFLEYAAEGGLVGLLGLLVFLGSVALCAARSLRAAVRRGPPGRADLPRLLAAAALAALTGWAVSSVVLHVRQFRTLLVLAAVVAALDLVRGALPPARPRAPAARGRVAGPWLALLAVAATLGAWVAGPGSPYQERHRASAVAVVTVRPGAGGLAPYLYDLLSRGKVVPTFAAVMSSRSVTSAALGPEGTEVRVTTRPRSGDLLVEVLADRPEVARRVAGDVLDAGARTVDALGTPWVVTRPGSGTAGVTARTVREPSPPVLAAGAALAVSALVLLWVQLELLHRRRHRRG